MSRDRAKHRKQQAWRKSQRFKSSIPDKCFNCGEPGARHFAPPSFGSPGFYICKPDGGNR
jgi:hypothetical protein